MKNDNEIKIFYAWQSETNQKSGKYFVRDAAEAACKKLSKDGLKVVLDHDTKNVPGLCDIPATILKKIRESDIFIADLTYIASVTSGGKVKHCSNPNVLFELGYAFHALGFEKIIAVQNSDHGPTDEEIFDINHRRHPVSFSPGQSEPEMKASSKKLTDDLFNAISLILAIVPRKNHLIQVEFLEVETEETPAEKPIETAGLSINPQPDFPLPAPRVIGQSAISALRMPVGFRGENVDYFRQLSDWLERRTLTTPFCFRVNNLAESPLSEILIEIQCQPKDGLGLDALLLCDNDLPRMPVEYFDPLSRAYNPYYGSFETFQKGDSYKFDLKLENLQPGRTQVTSGFRLGLKKSGSLVISGAVFAKELSKPHDFKFELSFLPSVEIIAPENVKEFFEPGP